MRHTLSMRERIAFLKELAAELRRLGEAADDPTLKSRFTDLAARCDQIAANIGRNLPIHERSARPCSD